ncbi:ubiquinol-cytochrome c reductase iron-sulfur subunit [Sinosporangium siamense]|uniref:Cytochrome bc1 complex Rieske iron-sulfur subunit n=1 Tax=Sinosporangium siamense TaxID=1367973 RepID=A0A919RIK4_9ACTN|nr:Rieske 2Fe-2S domain-containing protein [Sinosporangium siamense]GII94540.1 cytochrome bc1 complex Rieske iron-sulfur subunit [Sinosporangium siamense]
MITARRRAERGAAAAFGLTAVAGVFIGVVYVMGGNTALLGIGLAVAFASLAVGLALWAQHLLPERAYVEEREPAPSPPRLREALAAELNRDDRPLAQAPLPRRMLMLALAVLAVVAVFPVRSLLFRVRDPARALAETPWRAGARVVDDTGRRLRPADIPPGGMVTVYPDGHVGAADAMAVLVRVDPALLALPAGREGWNVDGLVCYSKLCTHAGCPVGLFVQTTSQLACPCHQSAFDVLRGAVPVAGPAARPLPQLPLGVGADGLLVARGGFTAPVGAGYWRRK